MGRQFEFQHDNHPKYTSQLVKNYLQNTKTNELEQYDKEEWSNLHTETCTRLVDGYTKRLHAVIHQKGHDIEY